MIHVLDVVLDDLHPRGVIDLCVELPGEEKLVRVDEQCCEVIRTVEPTRALENEERRCSSRNEQRIPILYVSVLEDPGFSTWMYANSIEGVPAYHLPNFLPKNA